MAKKSISEIVDLIEAASGDDDIEGLVTRYEDMLVTAVGAGALVGRLDERRELRRTWTGVLNLCRQLQMRQRADMRHQLEAATQALLQADGALALASAAEQHPIIFSSNMLATLNAIHAQAQQVGEVETVRLVRNRLRHLQLLWLARTQGINPDRETLHTITYQILEARNFPDLLERIAEYHITLSDAFDDVLTEIAREAGRLGHARVPKTAELRIAVLRALRDIVEAVVRHKDPDGGPDEAVKALAEATQADTFLKTVARFPFVLGEDFGDLVEREMQRARADQDEEVLAGLERRQKHLHLIGRIVTQLNEMTDGLKEAASQNPEG